MSGFSFGAPAAAAKPASTFGFGGFGQQSNQAGQQSAQTVGPGLFGAKPAPPAPAAGTGLFGQPTQSTAPATGSSLFSQQPAQGAQPSAGAGTGTGLFGQSQAQPAQPTTGTGLFGQSQAAPAAGSSLFGQPAASTSLFGVSQMGQAGAQSQAPQQQLQQQQAPNKELGRPLNTDLGKIYAAWNTADIRTCQFLYYFYNVDDQIRGGAGSMVPTGSIAAADAMSTRGRRPDAVGREHDLLWMEAVQRNPDPERLIPVLSVGFGDVAERRKLQMAEAQRQMARLAQVQESVRNLEAAHQLQTSVRYGKARAAQAALHMRIMRLVHKTASREFGLLPPPEAADAPDPEARAALQQATTLTQTAAGAASTGPAARPLTDVGAEADRLQALLATLETLIEGSEATVSVSGAAVPDGNVRLRAKLNELWAQIAALRARRAAGSPETDPGTTQWAVVDPSQLENVARILAEQQKGLVHLSDTLAQDDKTLKVILKGLTGVPLEGVGVGETY